MLYTWNEELIPARVRAGATLEDAPLQAAQQFEHAADAPVGDSSIRKLLCQISQPGEGGRSGEAHRLFNEALDAQRLQDESP